MKTFIKEEKLIVVNNKENNEVIVPNDYKDLEIVTNVFFDTKDLEFVDKDVKVFYNNPGEEYLLDTDEEGNEFYFYPLFNKLDPKEVLEFTGLNGLGIEINNYGASESHPIDKIGDEFVRVESDKVVIVVTLVINEDDELEDVTKGYSDIEVLGKENFISVIYHSKVEDAKKVLKDYLNKYH